MPSSVRLGIDIGGTFTDIVLLDEATGEVRIYKLPSTPANPAIGFLRGLDWALTEGGNVAEALRYVAHGTTVATNAIIEGKVARTALLVTRGFRDILEIARQTRPDLFDLFADKPRPLVPRNLVIEIGERLGPFGEVIEPLSTADVEVAANQLREAGVGAVAICFLHSYAYPEHERHAAEMLRERCPGLTVSLSSDVLPQFGEYLRASTTVVNAGLQAVVGSYLDQIEVGLAERGMPSSFYVMQSNGGVVASAMARQRPVYVVESGPAAGVIAAARLAETGAYADIISFDMGGTTAKAAMIQGGQPRLCPEIEVGAMATSGRGASRGRGYPIGTPALDLVEVGAGGGSVAWVDSGGMLRVGPQSAGADPGPACYGQGGIEPTVTDANLVLGRLDPAFFLGGEMTLNVDAARRALMRVAEPLHVPIVEAAAAILDIAIASMARAVHLVSTQRGFDVRDFTLVAFGGAGPLHANALAADLGIQRVLLPPGPGIFSAFGLMLADVEHDFVVTRLARFGELDHAAINAILAEFADRGRVALAADGVSPPQMEFSAALDIRYVGQSYQLPIPVPNGAFSPDSESLVRERFHTEHRRAYGYAAREEPIELVNIRLAAVGHTPKPATRRAEPRPGRRTPPIRARRPVYYPDCGFVDCPVYDRYRLIMGASVTGPAIIDEFDSTTVIFPGYQATGDQHRNLVIETVR